MKRSEERKIEESLVQVLEGWWDDVASSVNMPHVGDTTIEFMARSAMMVLLSIDDAQDSLHNDGMLKDEDK